MHLGQKKAFGFGPQDDPTAILPGGAPLPVMIGHRTSPQGYGAGAERQANRYEGSACPAGQVVVSHGSTPIRAAFIGAPTSAPYVYCKPQPVYAPPPPPAPVAGPTYVTTISPVTQTEISPQISPVFQQVQDSPGSVQSGAPSMIAPGGMEAEGGSAAAGGDSAMLDFMRMQSEQDAARRAEESAMREQERRDREARDYAFQQAQLDFQHEQARIQQERQAAIDAGAAEEAARLEAEYQAAQSEWEKTSAQPGGMVATAVMPQRQFIPGGNGVVVAPEKAGLPLPLIVALVAAVAVGGYFYASKPRKRKAK